ncbi:hypothetical protein OG689_02680 [Kitasatospora sp. NBC_00240]|uniref:hypothetical protein n=1 Tax=Kitasatospora sp. NBC_00240 TaxID=2903567 RepID=UPI002255CAA2|nr:hypothetical protein [Kitasatospora sp. NBC_00240]MCX5208222.1 hypothetical protein [Kitasatospora sp. NBC_00240]
MADGGDDGYRALVRELAGLVRLAHTALAGASAVLTDPADIRDGIPAAEKALEELLTRIEEDAALAPGGRAGVVVGVHVGCEVEALGGLAQRLLEAAWSRQERARIGARLRAPLRGLAEATLGLVARSADVLESGAPEEVADTLSGLHDVGQRQRLLYELLLREAATDPVDVTDLVMLCCCYQQCADRAGSIARHAVLFSQVGG